MVSRYQSPVTFNDAKRWCSFRCRLTWRLPRPPTPLTLVVRFKPCGSCLRPSNWRVCWFKRTHWTQTALFFYLAQRNADFLIAVKHGRREGFQLIRDRFTYGRRAP